MPDSTKKYQIQQKQADGMLTLHPETDADVVKYDGTSAGLTSTNVQDAVDELKTLMNDITGGGVVTGVKGGVEESYRQGNVNITKANIGLGNVDDTSDLNKPISTATQAALDSKANTSDLTNYIPTSQKGAANGVATLGSDSKIPVAQLPDLSATYIPVSQKGTNNGVATLGSDGRVPSSQLPSYVDDVIEGYYFDGKFYREEAHTNEITPEEGKIYIDIGTVTPNQQYRWSGTQYVSISSSLALGETAGTAYEGNKGKQNADNIAAIIAGTQAVGKATSADTATNANHATSADTADEATHAASADSATSATNATNVTTNINGHAISDIFETNGTTVKEATHAASAASSTSAASATTAESAAKLTTARAITLSGDVSGTANFDGSAPATITTALANVGTAGTYSVVTTDAKGRVTAGGQIIEVGATSQGAPSSTLAVGGIFFKKI